MNKLDWQECLKLARQMPDHYSMSENQQERLFEIASALSPKNCIVEIGVCNGKTAAVLEFCANRTQGEYFGIDNWSLENSCAGVGTALENLGLLGHLLEYKSTEAPWDGTLIDLLVIDGAHDEPNVISDCDRWIPLVKSGGFAAFHDWEEPFNRESAHWAINHYGNQFTQGWKHVVWEAGLEIRQKP
jgi:hypothetical protein